MISLKQYNSKWYETFLYVLPSNMKWNEIKQFLSTCTSMFKFTKLLGRGAPRLPTGMHTLVYEYTQFSHFHRFMGCRTHHLFFCQYHFSFASLHFLNASRLVSSHIQLLALGGDCLVKIVSPWETHESGFCLNGFFVKPQQILSFYSQLETIATSILLL